MPAIIHPPQLDPRDRLSDGDHGAGRRPPIDKRTGGNGDGDNENWDSRPVGRRGPRERLSQTRLGLASVLAADFMFFVAIAGSMIVTRSNGHFDAYDRYINEWLPTVIPSVLWLNTAVLLLSSASAEVARHSMFREQDVMDEWIGLGRPTSRRAGKWLAVTLVLGAMFLAGQYAAWRQLALQHVFYRNNPSSHFFYIITVTHAAHLFLGIAGMIAALVGLRRSRQFANRQILVDTTVWYWHAMGFLWVLLFALLEIFQ